MNWFLNILRQSKLFFFLQFSPILSASLIFPLRTQPRKIDSQSTYWEPPLLCIVCVRLGTGFFKILCGSIIILYFIDVLSWYSFYFFFLFYYVYVLRTLQLDITIADLSITFTIRKNTRISRSVIMRVFIR
jgi:hypothetical protein